MSTEPSETPLVDMLASDGWSGDAICLGVTEAKAIEKALNHVRQALATRTAERDAANRQLGDFVTGLPIHVGQLRHLYRLMGEDDVTMAQAREFLSREIQRVERLMLPYRQEPAATYGVLLEDARTAIRFGMHDRQEPTLIRGQNDDYVAAYTQAEAALAALDRELEGAS